MMSGAKLFYQPTYSLFVSGAIRTEEEAGEKY
jgi:hypothetical protein